MRVKMKTIYAGPAGNANPGEQLEVSAGEGKALVAGGYAEAVPERRAARRVETADAPPADTATAPAAETATAGPDSTASQ